MHAAKADLRYRYTGPFLITVRQQTLSCLYLFSALLVFYCPSQTCCKSARLVKAFLHGVEKIVLHVLCHLIGSSLEQPPIKIV